MMWQTHLVFGTACYMLSAKLGAGMFEGPEIAAAMVGSLLPDIDHPHSFVGRRLRLISVPLAAVVGHRGVTHSIFAVMAATTSMFLWWGEEWSWLAALGIGYLSHLLGDWMTPSGIPLLWPSRMKFRAPITFFTGGTVEKTVAGVLGVVLLWIGDVLPLHTLAGFQ
jgi:inner membrane protein